MEKTIQIQEGNKQEQQQLPLGQLFYLLYSNGFAVKPDDYIEMLKITERFGSQNIDETAKWICPIIATSETEQVKFYNIVEQYKKLTLADAAQKDQDKKKIPRWIKILAPIVIIALLFLTAFLLWPVKTYPLQEANSERVVEKGEPLLLDAANLLQAPEDSARIQFNWQFEDSNSATGIRARHVFSKPGDYIVKRHFASSGLTLAKKSDSLLVHVCEDLPKIQVNTPSSRIATGEGFNITADVDANEGTVSFYQWTIGDTVFRTATPVVKNFVLNREGDYTIQCKAVVGDVNAPCTATAFKEIKVQDNGAHYSLQFSPSAPGSYAAKTTLRWWVSLLLLLPAAGGLLYSIFKRKPKTKATPNQSGASKPINKGPYDVPFEQNDLKLIQQDRDLRRTFIQMRYRSEEETLVLSVPATIQSIIHSGGSPQLVYAPLTQQQQYLVLIDRSNPKSMLTHLFTWLVKSIADDGIPVTIFYYDKNFVCYNDSFPGGLSLQRLAETHSNPTLIIIGKAHELVYSAYPMIEEKFLRELNRWQSKAIITPTPLGDWGAKEKVLQQYFILLPADTDALQKLMPALREKIKPNSNLLKITSADLYSLKNTDFRDTRALQQYLNNDEHLFQWLCAICIYPRLRWGLVVELGKAILDKYGAPEKLNYNNLLKLCRISWMQQGVFQQATRLELLKLLAIDNEICVRERLLRMLNYSTSLYGERGYFFEEEKKRQQLTNQFILHASNNEQYVKYADSRNAFKAIWKKDAILDVPLKKYLDKTGNDHWQTPVSNGEHSVGLSEYFNLHELSVNKTIRVKRIVAAAASLILLSGWAWLNLLGGVEKLRPLVNLGQVQNPSTLSIGIKVMKNFLPCGDSIAGFRQLSGSFLVDKQELPLQWDAGKSMASFNIPFKSLSTGNAIVKLIWADNKSVSAPLVFTNRLIPDSLTITCINNTIAKKPLYIRYNDTTGFRQVETALGDALYQYTLSALESEFTDSSRIIYYEANQKARADSVIAIVQQTLGINVKEEFISEERNPPAVPILFLNLAKTALPSPDSIKEATYELMALASQAYADNQYAKALDLYNRLIALNASDPRAYYGRGLCYESLGNGFDNTGLKKLNAGYIEKALKDYDMATSLDPQDVGSWYNKGIIKYSLKKYAAAIPDLSKVVNINSTEAVAPKRKSSAIYFRGKSYYFLNNLSSACEDFKKAAALGVAAGRQDYGAYCNLGPGPAPDCNRTFYSMKEALSVNAAVICKLDLSKETLSSIPKELYGFKNCTQLNLGPNNIPQAAIDQLQQALPGCQITAAVQQQQAPVEFGYIELDKGGYTDAAGQQLMERVSRLLKAQPRASVVLTGLYNTDEEQKLLTGYMGTIVNMFTKIGVNGKTQLTQRIRKAPAADAIEQKAASGKMRIQVTGINFTEYGSKAK